LTGAGEGFLQGLVDPRYVFTDLRGPGLEEGLGEMARRLAAAGVIRDVQDLTRRLVERERLGCTSLGGGVAIPHCKSRDVEDVVLSIGLAPGGIDFRSADSVPVSLIFLILSPADQPAVHLQALARISRLLRTPGVVETLRRASTREEILEALKEAQPSPAAAGA
jgi:mannitol/fructose-specific phosphotransferase system IIA component (Ntr-type)